ncbi:SDR family NAD(P)-dependent oxidoreductase [Inconstantimicrobium mannanitabidum]|uniref:Short-chain dehydrogenase n=1 Tax=Inconstantimicrobium mannanitabidum TaxID=1604901 RepID=A0ACB5RHS0_9CLOT|nr:SDR family oxidoreductase [Clostridium sp. TW13]GKX68614.1 short-chain dehydrogenase [Clostridium sp. TW13]
MKGYTLITGASAGIGYELAKLFAMDKNPLILVARNEKRLAEIQKDFAEKYNVDVKYLALDLSNEHNVDYIYEFVEENNLVVDNLINNAGFGSFGAFHEVDIEKDLEMIKVNVYALTKLTKLFLPKLVERNTGGILNVASTAAFGVGPIMSVYYATKSYVLSLTEAIAEELKGTKIKISTLCPGPVNTGFQGRAGVEKSELTKGYMMTAKEVAEVGYKQFNKGKTIIIPGMKNKFLVQSFRFLPRKLISSIAIKLNKK